MRDKFIPPFFALFLIVPVAFGQNVGDVDATQIVVEDTIILDGPVAKRLVLPNGRMGQERIVSSPHGVAMSPDGTMILAGRIHFRKNSPLFDHSTVRIHHMDSGEMIDEIALPIRILQMAIDETKSKIGICFRPNPDRHSYTSGVAILDVTTHDLVTLPLTLSNTDCRNPISWTGSRFLNVGVGALDLETLRLDKPEDLNVAAQNHPLATIEVYQEPITPNSRVSTFVKNKQGMYRRKLDLDLQYTTGNADVFLISPDLLRVIVFERGDVDESSITLYKLGTRAKPPLQFYARPSYLGRFTEEVQIEVDGVIAEGRAVYAAVSSPRINPLNEAVVGPETSARPKGTVRLNRKSGGGYLVQVVEEMDSAPKAGDIIHTFWYRRKDGSRGYNIAGARESWFSLESIDQVSKGRSSATSNGGNSDTADNRMVDSSPELVGGYDKLLSRVQYPEAAQDSGIEGTVVVRILIDEEGNVLDPVITKSLGAGFDEEAIRVIMASRFKPGRNNGKPVRARMIQPITFRSK